jgi:hypothetical protein
LDRKDMTMENFDYFQLKVSAKEDNTLPNAFTLSWSPSVSAKVRLSTREDFAEYIALEGNGSCDITNLQSDTRYFVQAIAENGEKTEIACFCTNPAPARFIKIDGLTNVRDVGGRYATNGACVRQGLIYRGAEMNSHLTITEEGLATMREVMKIKSVIDLRRDTEVVEDVYKGVYVNVPFYAYTDVFAHGETVRLVFKWFADEENYPVYFHCWGGADRTGTVAFLLGALLGEELSALLDDYEITSLSVWGARSRNMPAFQDFLMRLNAFDGETLQQKIESYLRSVGVADEEMRAIKKIMLAY